MKEFRLIKFLFLIFALLYAFSYSVSPVYAKVIIGQFFGFSGDNYSSFGAATSQLAVPAFSLASVLVILYFMVGAFKYLKSGGNKEEIAGARLMIIHAIIGFIILMLAFLVLQFVLSGLFGVELAPFVNLFNK